MIENNDPETIESCEEESPAWQIGGLVRRSGGATDCTIVEEDDHEEIYNRRISRGLFRKFSLKVIEWIRKSLELGRNEVCSVYSVCPYLNLFMSRPLTGMLLPHLARVRRSMVFNNTFFVVALSSPRS